MTIKYIQSALLTAKKFASKNKKEIRFYLCGINLSFDDNMDLIRVDGNNGYTGVTIGDTKIRPTHECILEQKEIDRFIDIIGEAKPNEIIFELCYNTSTLFVTTSGKLKDSFSCYNSRYPNILQVINKRDDSRDKSVGVDTSLLKTVDYVTKTLTKHMNKTTRKQIHPKLEYSTSTSPIRFEYIHDDIDHAVVVIMPIRERS